MNSTATSTTDNGVNYVVNENKSISTSGTAAATSAFSIIGTANGAKYEEIPDLVVGETYTLSGCDENGASGVYQLQFNIKKSDGTITYNADYGKTFTFTHEEGNTYLSYVRYGSSVTANQTFYPMIRPIDTDDTYVPHEEKTTYISLTEPLRGIGNIADSIKKVEGLYQAERKFIELIFDGSDDEEFSLHSTNDNGIANFHITSSSFDFNNSCQSICTHFTRNNNSISTITEECYAVSTNAFYFRVKSERCSTVEEWKTLLAESPVKIVIEVLTTIIEDLDQTPFYNLKTFDDVTLISASDDAEMEVSYYRNTEDGKRIADSYTLATQTLEKLSWIVSSGDSQSSFTLTDRMAEIIAEAISLNGNVKVNGDMLVDGSVTVDKINVDNLGAISAKIGKLTIDENGILTSEFLHESLVEEGSLVDDYINIDYEYWAPSVNDYKVVSGKTTLGFEDMVFERTNGYTDPHYTMISNGVSYPLTSDVTVAKYSANGLDRRTSYKSEGTDSAYMTLALSGLTFKDSIGTDNLPYIEAILSSSLLRVYGDAIFSKSIKHRSGADVPLEIGAGSSAKTVTLTIPSDFYQTGTYANRTYYTFNVPLLYTNAINIGYGGIAILFTISGVVYSGSTYTLNTQALTPNSGSSYVNYTSAPSISSMDIATDGTMTLTLSIPANGSIMSMSSTIGIA